MEKNSKSPDEHQPSVKELLTVMETATFLGVMRSWVYKMSHNRVVPHYTTGKRVYFKREDLIGWVTKNRVSSSEEIEREAVNYLVK